MFNIRSIKIAGFLFVLASFSVSGYTEEVEDTIEEALQYYQSGDYTDAVASLTYASQLIQQKKGGGLELLLPEPLAGWVAQDASSQAMGASMFGGGISAERQYTKNSRSITVQIITDSPIMQGIMMMFSNPMFATSDGGKLERVGSQKAIVKFDAGQEEGDLKIVVANRYLVSIEGRGINRDDLIEYAKAIDYKKLQSLP